MDSRRKPKRESGFQQRRGCLGSRGAQASGTIPAEGSTSRSLTEAQQATNSCQKTQGCAAADAFGLDHPEERLGRKAKLHFLLSTRAAMGRRAEAWEGCAERGQSGGKMCRFQLFLPSHHFPLDPTPVALPVRVLACETFRAPQQRTLGAVSGDSFPPRPGRPARPFSSAALGTSGPCTCLAVILL